MFEYIKSRTEYCLLTNVDYKSISDQNYLYQTSSYIQITTNIMELDVSYG